MAVQSKLQVTPVRHSKDKLCEAGAIVTGVNLNHITDEEVQILKETTHKYKVILIKNQHNLEPINHWNFITRLDPVAKQVHGHGTVKDFHKTGGLLAKRPVMGIPGAENVRLIGKGYQGADSYGIKDFTAGGASNSWHISPPSAESFAAGNTQFQRWHIDAPLYEREPPHFTALRCIQNPIGPPLTVNWDDGSNLSMKVKPGGTAFISTVQLYNMLSTEEKESAEHSWVEYAPYPYMWLENAKSNNNGLGLVTQGKEHKLEELPEWNPDFVKTYPCVWKRPNGERALQIHGIAVRKLFLKKTAGSEVEIIEDLRRIREILGNWQKRILRPEYIYVPDVEEGDVQLWDNWSVFHTGIDYPAEYGTRTMHQANLGASDAPEGVVPISVV